MQIPRPGIGLWLALAAIHLGCVASSAVPASLQRQVDRTLTFGQLKESPDSYRGRILVLGGEVLAAKRLKQWTRIQVLQLPLDESKEPGMDRTASQGRFLAVQREFLDPATLPAGTRVTITGEVTGATTLPFDETEYTYPTLEIKNLKVWPKGTSSQYWPGPYAGPYRRPYRWGYPHYWW